jgi:hypothetical protein
MMRGGFANPNLEPSGATPNGGSLHQGGRQLQQASATASGLAPAAHGQTVASAGDAMRQQGVALQSGLHNQQQAAFQQAAESAQSLVANELQTAHALRVLQMMSREQDTEAAPNLKALAMMLRAG